MAKTEPVKEKQVSKGDSLLFKDKKIIFGSSSEDFLKSNSEYKLCDDNTLPKDIKVYCNLFEKTDENGNMTWFKTYFIFYKNELFEMEINERWTDEKYMNTLEKLVKEFQTVKEENNEEEGWFTQEIKKGNLVGSYGGDSDGTVFNCYDKTLMGKVKTQYPDYKKE